MTKPLVPVRQVIVIAFFIALLSYLNADIRLNGADEGFLWYGASHVLRGQVPVRDFLSYDPGRYYFCAAFFSLFGDGIMSLRLAETVFQFISISFALLTMRRVLRSRWALLGAGFLAFFCMVLPFRNFDSGIPLITLFFAVRLLENPSYSRHFTAGVFCGLAAFFGINHGLYAFLSYYLLIVFCDMKGLLKDPLKKKAVFLGGICTGLLPLMGMMIFIPGFFESYSTMFLENVHRLRHGMTNVPLAAPWPWLFHWDGFMTALQTEFWWHLQYISRYALGVSFLLLILFYGLSIPVVFRLKKETVAQRALFIASVFTGVFYLHHIFSRADSPHFGEGFFPVVAGILSIPALFPSLNKNLSRSLVLLVSLAGFLAAGLLTNIVFKIFTPKAALVHYTIGKDKIWIIKPQADMVDHIKKIVSENVPPNETLLMAPIMTTFYCLLEKDSPVYDLYFLSPQSDRLQQKMIQDLEAKHVNWGIVGSGVVDGGTEFRLADTQPRLWEYLATRFEAVPTSEPLRLGYQLIRRRSV